MRLALAFLLGLVTLAWGDPADDLKSCQAQVVALTMQGQQAQQDRVGYVAQLGELIAEIRAQLVEKNAQLQAVKQELQRLKTPKPEEKQ